MRWSVVVLILCSVGCVHADRVALATSTATIACDWVSTRHAAEAGWIFTPAGGGPLAVREHNPLLGPQPSTRAIDVYFLATLVANAAIWTALPPSARGVFGGGMTAFELRAVIINEPVTGPCGL